MELITEARSAAERFEKVGFPSTVASARQFLARTADCDRASGRILDEIYNFIRGTELPKGSGGRLAPLGWQQMVTVSVFGALAGLPMGSMTLVCLPRKQGKTSFAAALGLAALAFAPDTAPAVHCVATKREQAALVWNDAQTILRRARKLRPRNTYRIQALSPDGKFHTFGTFRILRDRIELVENPSAYWNVLAHDSKTLDGLHPTMTIIDEAALVGDDVYNVIQSAQSDALAWSHTLAISTANSETGLWFPHFCRRGMHDLLAGRETPHNLLLWLPPENPATGECELTDEDRGDPKVWSRINPAWGVTITEASMRRYYEEGKTRASNWREFQVKRLNEWGVPDHDALCTPAEAAAICNAEWTEYVDTVLRTRPCVLGADIALKKDMTVIAALAISEDGILVAKLRHFLCEASRKERVTQKRQVLLDEWVARGDVVVAGDDRIDFGAVKAQCEAWIGDYGAYAVHSDRMTRGYSLHELIEGTLPVQMCIFPPKGDSALAKRRSAVNFFVDRFTGGRLRVADDPCFRWELGNAALGSFKDGGLDIIRRDPEGGGIDGLYAIIHGAHVFDGDFKRPDLSLYSAVYQKNLELFSREATAA